MTIDVPPEADVPSRLRQHDQWVCWREQSRGEKPTKVPVNPRTGQYASTNKPETWTTFEDAAAYARANAGNGLGFVFTSDDPLVGIDLDSARDQETDSPTEWAATIIDQLDSYTEISPSGTGYHVLVEGTLPPGRNRRRNVELYETGRFFTVTGAHVESLPTSIHERTEALTTVYKAHVAADEDDSDTAESDSSVADETQASNASAATDSKTLSDDEVIERARKAANSAKFERLWRGETAGYDSHSEADMALSCLFAFWTGGDTGQMDRLFRRSGLHREKWDAVHYGDGRTYGETTIERATSVTSDVYSPSDDGDSINTETETGIGDNTATEMAESTAAVMTNESGTHLHERERARIETITKLEQTLRELESENERLRAERDEERAKRRALESVTSTASPTVGGWVSSRLRNLIPWKSR
ncbi:phage NrS-1 polymerase family protein [Haladaptatus sp. DFWS20]|uniref:phage NrS-1 polymerase family protein n=1 Tax=Haladaptatus sp. DFWS20 TaxID=3403467 RepID=UPI003EBFCFD7